MINDTAIQIRTFPTMLGDLPAFVFPPDHDLSLAQDIEVGQTVAFYTRGRYRAAKVTKVTPKRVTAIYTTVGARDQAEKIAQINYVANAKRDLRNAEITAKHYRAEAEVVEQLNLVTEGFVPFASLPAEYRAITDPPNNYSKTTIVHAPERLREWATSAEARVAKAPEKLAEAAAKDAVPYTQRVIEATHITTKNVKRGEVFAV